MNYFTLERMALEIARNAHGVLGGRMEQITVRVQKRAPDWRWSLPPKSDSGKDDCRYAYGSALALRWATSTHLTDRVATERRDMCQRNARFGNWMLRRLTKSLCACFWLVYLCCVCLFYRVYTFDVIGSEWDMWARVEEDDSAGAHYWGNKLAHFVPHTSNISYKRKYSMLIYWVQQVGCLHNTYTHHLHFVLCVKNHKWMEYRHVEPYLIALWSERTIRAGSWWFRPKSLQYWWHGTMCTKSFIMGDHILRSGVSIESIEQDQFNSTCMQPCMMAPVVMRD